MIEVLSQKLPVSVLLRGLLERCFTPELVDRLFERHAQSQYTQQLLFSTVCGLLLHVVLRVKPSLYAAYREQAADLEVSAAALYDKVKGVELGVSAALVRETARDLAAWQLGSDPRRLGNEAGDLAVRLSRAGAGRQLLGRHGKKARGAARSKRRGVAGEVAGGHGRRARLVGRRVSVRRRLCAGALAAASGAANGSAG